jgi:hypothetical protein
MTLSKPVLPVDVVFPADLHRVGSLINCPKMNSSEPFFSASAVRKKQPNPTTGLVPLDPFGGLVQSTNGTLNIRFPYTDVLGTEVSILGGGNCL